MWFSSHQEVYASIKAYTISNKPIDSCFFYGRKFIKDRRHWLGKLAQWLIEFIWKNK